MQGISRDGRLDLLIANQGSQSLTLLLGLGDGRFADVAAQQGLVSPRWNTGAAFLDAEGDGDLDLFIEASLKQGV